MKKMLLFLAVLLVACSAEEYDCHIVTKHHLFTETKLCDGICSPMVRISDVKEQITDRHEIVERSDLKSFMDAEYASAAMVNSNHPDFVTQMGFEPVQVIKLECSKL